MGHVSRKLSNSFEGALAGGGDPATSPLYVFGPFLRLIVVAGVAQITFGASIWLVIFTIAMVSAMYRMVMVWVTDGSGGSGLSEEEFGSWAVKINASITFVEYTLTFLVSMAALVTFIADRVPTLNEQFLGIQFRTWIAILLSIGTGWLVNRGPKIAARAFGPATAGVLILLWVMIIATIIQYGFRLPNFNLKAFSPEYLPFTFGGYARILAVMTGIEIFANLVAAYDGTPRQKGRKAFGSLVIIMGTTGLTMLIVGPAIFELADPTNEHISVFTQTMDLLLPNPLPWLGTLVGIAVLASASAASAQGLQNLALGLKYRNYIPASIGQRNRFDVADRPVWIEVGIVAVCFILFGTHEETYLAIYAAGVFILLSMTGWAAAKRLLREIREEFSLGKSATLVGTLLAAVLTSFATVIIFEERFFEGAWTYLVMIPALYVMFGYFRKRIGDPTPVEDRLGQLITERKYLFPFQDEVVAQNAALPPKMEKIVIPLDGSPFSEQALSAGRALGRAFDAQINLLYVDSSASGPFILPPPPAERGKLEGEEPQRYLEHLVSRLNKNGIPAEYSTSYGAVADEIINFGIDTRADLIAMSTHGRSGMERLVIGSVASKVMARSTVPMLFLRPTDEWRSRWTEFKRILVALDGSDASEKTLPYAIMLAKQFDSEVTLLSVPEGDESEELRQRVRRYLEKMTTLMQEAGIETQAIVTGQGPARTIVSVSETEDIDLVIISTRGRGGVERFMVGSAADRVVRQTVCPVFLVPAHDV